MVLNLEKVYLNLALLEHILCSRINESKCICMAALYTKV